MSLFEKILLLVHVFMLGVIVLLGCRALFRSPRPLGPVPVGILHSVNLAFVSGILLVLFPLFRSEAVPHLGLLVGRLIILVAMNLVILASRRERETPSWVFGVLSAAALACIALALVSFFDIKIFL